MVKLLQLLSPLGGNIAIFFSRFEHVFVGEIKVDYVSGFHNWVQFYRQESVGNLNYYGYVSKSEVGVSGLLFIE